MGNDTIARIVVVLLIVGMATRTYLIWNGERLPELSWIGVLFCTIFFPIGLLLVITWLTTLVVLCLWSLVHSNPKNWEVYREFKRGWDEAGEKCIRSGKILEEQPDFHIMKPPSTDWLNDI